MSNPYCTPAQFFALYDRRSMLQLSSDDSDRDGDLVKVQTILDVQASELESYLSGRWSLPLVTVPAVLTKWVAVTAAVRMYARRTDAPSSLNDDKKWSADWIEQLQRGVVVLPGVDRGVAPTLTSSDFTDGRSRWDRVLGGLPSATGPSKGI
jgi:phage gp36-like protein